MEIADRCSDLPAVEASRYHRSPAFPSPCRALAVKRLGPVTASIRNVEHVPSALGSAAQLLGDYGYLAILGGVMLEDFGIPVPGETLLLAGAAGAGAGALNIAGVLLAGFVGAVVGDSIGFAIGHFGGRPLVLRLGRYVFLTPRRLDRVQRLFRRHGAIIVVGARFIEGLRQFGGLAAGVSGMSWARFRLFNAAGAALWVSVWGVLGYVAGNHIEAIDRQLSRLSAYVVVALAAVIALTLATHLLRRR